VANLDLIKEMRKQKQWNQKEAADFLGISVHSYSNYEIGRRIFPDKLLIKLASPKGFNIDIEQLRFDKVSMEAELNMQGLSDSQKDFIKNLVKEFKKANGIK
jgi:Helix-turn-helix.